MLDIFLKIYLKQFFFPKKWYNPFAIDLYQESSCPFKQGYLGPNPKELLEILFSIAEKGSASTSRIKNISKAHRAEG